MEPGYLVTPVTDATAAFSEACMQAAANAPMLAHAILTMRELLDRVPLVRRQSIVDCVSAPEESRRMCGRR